MTTTTFGNPTPRGQPPAPQTLSEGALGIALLHLERGDHAAARPLLAETVRGGVSTGANASLFHGAPALEFVLGRADHVRPPVTAAVDRVVAARLNTAARRRREGRLAPLAEFDLIQGLTGLGALLLSRPDAPLLPDLLSALVSLARPAPADPALPGWWAPGGPGHRTMPGGHSNNGMAHGVAGPLALLALATRRGVAVDGQVEAIGRFARWLERHGGYWVTRDQLPPYGPTGSATDWQGRPSWCYGQVGVARALQLSGLALGDPARTQAAEDLALNAITDPASLSLITDASLCHGWAGLLTVVRSLAADSHSPDRLAEELTPLAERVAAGLDALPKPGFLEGRAGALLALEGTDTTGWTRALLIT